VHAWTFGVLQAAVDMHRQSNGLFDVTVAPVLQDLGWLPPAGEGRRAGAAASPFDAVELLEGQRVRLRYPGSSIDLGGIAKGFAVDSAVETLRSSGAVRSGLVNAGGDLAAFGEEAQRIHVRHPRDPARAVCAIDVQEEALASSARRFDPFHCAKPTVSAIIDPVGGKPASAVDGVAVRAPTCLIADALTKVVMIAGTQAIGLLERYEASALLVSASGDVHISHDFRNAVHLAA
jgi:FAD:protein FMN transferase